MTLIDQRAKSSFDSAQMRNPRSNDVQLPAAELFGLAAVPTVVESKQISHLIEGKAQRLGFLDKP